MRTYVAFYSGKEIYFEAESLYSAKTKALKLFNVPKSKWKSWSGPVVVLADVPLSTAAL
jgi:hypothetical protein